MLTVLDATWWLPLAEVAAGFAGGVLALALLAGQVWAWIERQRIDLAGGVA